MIRSKRGDTIIEVMLAMAIIGLVLAAAYATAARNLRTSRFTQERTEALKIAEGQIELMKSLSGSSRDLLYPPESAEFCLPAAGGAPVRPAAGNAACQNRFYEITIQRAASNDVFIIFVRWIPEGGSDANRAEVKITYTYPQGVTP